MEKEIVQTPARRESTPEPIPFIALHTDAKKDAIEGSLKEFNEIVRKSQFILGDAVKKFEASFAGISGCKHGVGVNSGLDALILGLRAMGVGAGDEVITAPNSFIASAAAIALVGAKPVFADVCDDFNLDPALVEKAVTSKTKAIMPVHLTGNPCKMDEINAIARRHNLKVLEDAAQAVGATFDGKPVGALSDLGCFSLHPLKNLHVWGDGGMCTTNSEEMAYQLGLQRNHGLKNRDEVEFYSYNSRLDTLQAVVGLHHLPLLEETTKRRRRNAELYEQGLIQVLQHVRLPISDKKRAKHVYHVFQIRANDRDKLKAYLQEKGIETKVHYPLPIHWQKASQYLGYKKGDFPVTDRLAGEILSLPVRESLEPDDIFRVCEAVRHFYKK